MQHVSRHRVLVAGVTDAKAHPAVAFAKMPVDRPQAVVTGMPASLFQPHPGRRKVQLIMKDCHVGEGQLPKGQRGLHRLARKVHERLGFQEGHLFVPKAAFGDEALERLAPRGKPVIGSDAVQRHEADVVAVAGVFRPRIAKADPKFHGASPRGWTGVAPGFKLKI